MKIIKTLLITSILSFSTLSMAEQNANQKPYPIPKNLNNWENNYNPTSVEDYRKYRIFLAERYNATRSFPERRSIVKEQNRARNYSASNYDKRIVIQKVSSNGDNINNIKEKE